MLRDLIAEGASGKPVFISRVHDAFAALPVDEKELLVLIIDLLEGEEKRSWSLWIPRLDACDRQERGLVREYVYAEIYNILSSIGAKAMRVLVDHSDRAASELAGGLNGVFSVDLPMDRRVGYGRAINVLDRMMAAVCPGEPRFRFYPGTLPDSIPATLTGNAAYTATTSATATRAGSVPETQAESLSIFHRCTRGLEGKAFCGIDVGGTDIKAVLVDDGRIVAYKEYDWFPAAFTRSRQLVDPICRIVRLLQARLWLDRAFPDQENRRDLLARISPAMDKEADDSTIERILAELETEGVGNLQGFDGIGLCFPDVVVRNKIVGGEVYKTRGIRNNPDLDYESDFAELTGLDELLKAWVKPGGKVRIINDGPMASFTAAVEIAASGEAAKVAKGVFAHTLGTELGTGWVTKAGDIPDIPLEVYNFIVDLGSHPEREFESDDLRSLNNFNTGLPGTLQKYCSQSGVFRLAMKYFPSERPDLFKELQAKSFVVKRPSGTSSGWYVPTEPLDQRKPFLEHMMSLPDREGDETNRKIWRGIGEALAVTLLETRRILNPGSDERFLFGRLVKNRSCFELMQEGARNISGDAHFVIAGAGMANTPLMKQLENHPVFTVAQFAQAIGAVYFANSHQEEQL